MRLKHDEVIIRVTEYLKKGEGYSIRQTATGWKRGPDIVAEKDGRELIIEAVGSISRSGHIKESADLDVDFFTNLGQLICRMDNDDTEYALACDEAYEGRIQVKLLGYPKERIGIKVFMITRESIRIL